MSLSRAADVALAHGAVEHHTRIAQAFHDLYSIDANRLERVRVWRSALARHAPGDRSLAYDIGCGTGRLTAEIAPRAARVIAIDGSEGMLMIAERHLAGLGHRHVELRHAMLPLADVRDLEPAPLVIASSVVEYLPDLHGAVAMLAAVTAPGGVLMVSISNRASLSRAVVRVVHRLTGRPRYLRHVLHFSDPPRLKALIEGAGLQLVETLYFGGEDRLNRLLRTVLPQSRSANMILAVAKRPA